MKKKILITMTSMFIGGAERSLIGLLEKIDYNLYDVYLFIYRHEGEFMKCIPKEVHILPAIRQYESFDKSIKELLCSKGFVYGVARLFSKIELNLYCKLTKKEKSVWKALQYTTKYLMPLLPRIPGEYDLAIGFIGIHQVLNEKVKAEKKMGWIHTDYNTLKPNVKMDCKVYDRLDYIVNVSEECTKAFLHFYPQYRAKSVTIENILSSHFIRKQGKECEEEKKYFDDNECIYFCSVGRFTDAKNFENVPAICKQILKSGINVCWYLIGYGGDEEKIRNAIVESDMANNVIILGKKENPYPYMNLCDFYIQPSRYEGKAVSVREAQILQKPVIITDFATSGVQLENGVDGIIVPMGNEACAKGIVEVIRNKELQKRLIQNMQNRDYSNGKEIEKIYQVIEGK